MSQESSETSKRSCAKASLLLTRSYESGFNSSSRLYEHASDELGLTPATYSRGGRGVNINYTIVASRMGRLLVAVQSVAFCAREAADNDAELEKDLREEFPQASDQSRRRSVARSGQKILDHLDNNEPSLDLPLDIRATAFQRQVWEKLSDPLRSNGFVRRGSQSAG